jgi:hypothetical protein
MRLYKFLNEVEEVKVGKDIIDLNNDLQEFNDNVKK